MIQEADMITAHLVGNGKSGALQCEIVSCA